MLSSYRNQSIDLANQLTGFYVRATLALNGLKALSSKIFTGEPSSEIKYDFVMDLSRVPILVHLIHALKNFA